jgi:hypothetical protein
MLVPTSTLDGHWEIGFALTFLKEKLAWNYLAAFAFKALGPAT